MSRGAIRARIIEYEVGGKAWPRDPDGAPHYPPDDRLMSDGKRRALIDEGAAYSWRLDMQAALARAGTGLTWTESSGNDLADHSELPADPGAWGDVVLARKAVPTSYHLSVVTDDALQGISHVVRGQDLYAATGVHRVLQELLGLPAPVYHHHRLILGPDGRKLSKSLRDTALAALREAGETPEGIRHRVELA